MESLKGKKLVSHFDGKQGKQIEEDHNITVTLGRIFICLSSPDIHDTEVVLHWSSSARKL